LTKELTPTAAEPPKTRAITTTSKDRGLTGHLPRMNSRENYASRL
jgi:hypothetical protein